jgi:hypothetical protein
MGGREAADQSLVAYAEFIHGLSALRTGTRMPVPDDVRVAYFPVLPSASYYRLFLPTTTSDELLLAGLNISQDHPQCLL